MKRFICMMMALAICVGVYAQGPVKVYDETIDPNEQITEAIAKAKANGKFVVAQLGGNWCKWCIRFAKFVNADPEIKQLVNDNFEFIHVNYNPRANGGEVKDDATKEMLRKLGNPVRFGYPVLVVLDEEGNVIHTQDSGYLESGEGYDKEKVMRFFSRWTPEAVASAR